MKTIEKFITYRKR